MDDCPICFGTPSPLPPSFLPTSILTVYIDPTLTLGLTFGENMGQTVEPLPTEFVIVVDGVDKAPLTFTWASATEATITYSEVALGPVVVRLRYPTASARFRSVLLELITPFDFLTSGP